MGMRRRRERRQAGFLHSGHGNRGTGRGACGFSRLLCEARQERLADILRGAQAHLRGASARKSCADRHRPCLDQQQGQGLHRRQRRSASSREA